VRAAGFEVLPVAMQHDRGASLERITDLEDKPWGLREFALLDIDHNLLRIGQPLGSGQGRTSEPTGHVTAVALALVPLSEI
jgi:2-iminoacetate synthase ThiH